MGAKLPLILVYWEEVRGPFWPSHPSRYLSALCFVLASQQSIPRCLADRHSSFYPRSGKEFRAADILRPARALLPPLGPIPSVRWRYNGYPLLAI